MTNLIHGDCLEENQQIESGSVDLILTDLPYGTMKGIDKEYCGYGRKNGDGHLWDNIIDTDKIMQIANRILRKNGKMILFAQDPFSTELKNKATHNIPYSYSMIWEKDDFANALLSKKACVNYYEDILLFSKDYEIGKNIIPKNPIYYYLQECKIKSRKSIKEFNYLYSKYKGKITNPHRSLLARSWETSQFLVPSKDIYENVLQPTGFFSLNYNELLEMDTTQIVSTFNLWQGNKYKSNILKYKKDYNGFHPTQKPILLLEDLIKTFTNENNLVVDLTMGSGSTGVACKNTSRQFIGIEKELKYFNIATDRINKNYQPELF